MQGGASQPWAIGPDDGDVVQVQAAPGLCLSHYGDTSLHLWSRATHSPRPDTAAADPDKGVLAPTGGGRLWGRHGQR